MKRVGIIVSILLLVLLIGRAVMNTGGELDNEIEEYVRNLNYDFSAKIDSIVVTNDEKDLGVLVCRITNGTYNKFVEDSLNRHLINYKRIRFLSFDQDGRFRKFLPDISKYRPNDSIVVSSKEDKYYIFRNSKTIFERKMSQSTSHKVYFAFWLPD